MTNLKKFVLSATILCSVCYTEELKECKNDKDKITGCFEVEFSGYLTGKVPYKNGKKEGIVKWYRSLYNEGEGYKNDGILRGETIYKDGKIEGILKRYYENGKLEKEIPYKNGKKDGVKKWYYENGGLAETPYKDDKLDGIVKEYYDNGNFSVKFKLS